MEFIAQIQSKLGHPVIPVRELANNGKCSVWQVSSEGQELTIKTLITDDEFYTSSFHEEIQIYRTFAEHPPDLYTPKIVCISEDSRTIALEHIDGQILSSERYPSLTGSMWKSIAATDLLRVTESLRGYKKYNSGSRDEILTKYHHRWNKHMSRGIYNESDREILNALRNTPDWSPEFNHGDPVPSNIIINAARQIYLIDWEFAGSYIPLYDAAVLRVVTCKLPRLHTPIDSHFTSASMRYADRLCFACNLLNVAARELWIHMELPDGHRDKDDGVQLGQRLLIEARAMIRALDA